MVVVVVLLRLVPSAALAAHNRSTHTPNQAELLRPTPTINVVLAVGSLEVSLSETMELRRAADGSAGTKNNGEGRPAPVDSVCMRASLKGAPGLCVIRR